MRVLLIALLIALIIVPALSQPTYVGGNYGKAWLASYGTKNIIPQAVSLWDWGMIPKGQLLDNGTLISVGESTLIYPAFAPGEESQLSRVSLSPVILSEKSVEADIGGLNKSDLNRPFLYTDPWFMAQQSNQPILVRGLP